MGETCPRGSPLPRRAKEAAMSELEEIQEALREQSSESVRQSFHKFVPGSQHVYGVKVPRVNDLARRHRKGGFDLVEACWEAGAFEERLLAAKILALIAKQDPERSLALIKAFSKNVSDWAVCDTLGQQSSRPIATLKQKEILGLSEAWVNSSRPWQRRLSLVLLENYSKEARLRPLIRRRMKQLENDKEYYVKKAVEWTRRNLEKYK